MDAVKNFAKVTVSDVGYDDNDTEIELIAGHGIRLPDPPFNATWWNITDFPDPADDVDGFEIVRVTDITDDTLTIIRGQEGTDGREHNELGKTYALMAGWTAGAAAQLRPISYNGTSMEIDTATGNITIGDAQDFGNGTKIAVNDSLNLVGLLGKFQTNQQESASVAVGTLVAKLPVYDGSGDLIGYIPIYGSIT